MGVKKMLAQQSMGFVSLHDLLIRMTKLGDGASYKEAATLLHRLLYNEEDRLRPKWFSDSHLYGKHLLEDRAKNRGWDCLRQASIRGEPEDDDIPF